MRSIQIPLLHDHHNHVSLYASLAGGLVLNDISSAAGAMNRLAGLPPDRVSMVTGWNSGLYGFTPDMLEGLPPVVIANLSLHGCLMNSQAEERLAPVFPSITDNYRNQEWCEAHCPELISFFASVQDITGERLSAFFNQMAAAGVYSADDMLLPNEMSRQAITGSRYSNRVSFWTVPEVFQSLSRDARADIKGLKLFTDGALGTRSAAISTAFRSGDTGMLLYSDDELLETLSACRSLCSGVAVHAIGDRAVAQTVRLCGRLARQNVVFNPFRIEHCQFIDPATAARAKELGIVLCMQPNFNTDSRDYRDRLPKALLPLNNPFRMLIDDAGFIPGTDLIFGSDGMPHGVDAAVRAALFPPYPGQRLTLEEFAAGYCINDPGFEKGCIRIIGNHSIETLRTEACAIPDR